MPELPEVETIRSGLEIVLPGKTISRADVFYSGSVKIPDPKKLQTELPGLTVKAVSRRGKYLQIELDDSSVLVVHLRMTGKLIFSVFALEQDKHTHVVFHFSDGSLLAFHDVRKFGTIYWLKPEHFCDIHGLFTLGPEPLSCKFHADYLEQQARHRNVSIKGMLLNQQIIAGLGNIYADEALHRAGIRPDRPSMTLTRKEHEQLYRSICEVLTEAIIFRGTTMSDYRDAAGSYGQFQEHLRVYMRQDKPCLTCGRLIIKKVVAGRGTHFCPDCQI